VTVASERDEHDGVDRRRTLLRGWRPATRPASTGELAEEQGESGAAEGELGTAEGEWRAALKLATVGLVCLGLGIAIGYLVWGTRTMELARRVASLKETMAEHARDTIAEWTELEAKLRAAELELARLRGGPGAPATDGLAPALPGPGAANETGVETTPSLPSVPSQSHLSRTRTPPAPERGAEVTRPSEATRSDDSAAKRSDGRPRRVPLELPRRPPELSGSPSRPMSP
jgi:hypothetical protein